MAKAASFIVVLFSFASLPEVTAHPYRVIAERNIFGLKDPPPRPVSQPPPPRPAPKLVLTGVVDFRSEKWAFVTRTDAGAPPKNYTLTLGETEGGLQVVEINAESEIVRLRVDGAEPVALHLADATNHITKPAIPARLTGVRVPLFPRVR